MALKNLHSAPKISYCAVKLLALQARSRSHPFLISGSATGKYVHDIDTIVVLVLWIPENKTCT